MSYRNKTYVAFASEDIDYYRLMTAWVKNDKFDFSFFNAHDLYEARDTSSVDTIRRSLRERLKNAKQVVLIGSKTAKKKGDDGESFLWYEIKVIREFNLPVVIANHDGDRTVDRTFVANQFLQNDYYTLSTSFQPKVIQYALDDYAVRYATSDTTGPRQYKPQVYTDLGI